MLAVPVADEARHAIEASLISMVPAKRRFACVSQQILGADPMPHANDRPPQKGVEALDSIDVDAAAAWLVGAGIFARRISD